MAGSGLLYFDVGGGGNRVSVVNSDGTNQTQLVGSTATLQEPQDIGLDTAAGFYFGISNKSGAGDVAHLVRGSLSGGDVVVVADYGVGSDANNSAGDDNLVNALQVDPLNHKIYVGIQEPTGTKPANSGIRQYSYDPATGAVTDQGWLVQLSASTKPKEGSLYLFGPTDFSLDSGTGKLFISEVFSGTAKAQGIFSLNLSSPNTVTQVVAQSQFPDSLSGATVHDVVADTSTQLLYFTSSAKGGSYGQGNYVPANVGQNAIWYVPETGNGATAVKVALTPPDGSHFYPLSLTIDQSTRQLYVESVENAGLNTTSDVIEVYQLDAAGTGATYLRTIQPTNHSTQGNQTRGLAFNAAPVLTGAGSSTATESAGTNSTAAAAAGSVTVSDDEGQIKSATVSITGGFLTGTGHQDSLSFTNQNGITGSYNSGTGVLTLTGTATAASYQTALNSVQFIDSGDNPTAYGTNTTRTISFTVNDGVLASGTATSTVTVVGTNDAPAITGTRGTVDPQTEDTPFTISKATFFAGITDPDDQSGNTSPGLSIVSITNGTTTDTSPGGNSGGITFTPTADYNGSYTINYRVTDPHGGSVDASFTTSLRAVADIVADSAVTNANVPVNIYVQANDTFENAAHNIAGVTTPAHGSVSINDNGTPGNAADDYLVYTPAAGYSGSDSFSYSIGSGGVFESANVAVTVNFVPNHAPTGTNKTITTNEDTAYTLAASDFGFGDAGDTPANRLAAVGITTRPGAGSLTNNGTAVTAGQFVSVADINAGHLVFTPAANASGAGYASFTFQVQDDGGTASGGVDTDQSPNTLTFTVVSVNDAPGGTDKTVTTNEDTAYTIAAADFGFSDANDGNALAAVKITTIPGAGTLTNNGTAVTAGQFVSAADIDAGRLVFAPAANANGAGYASFTFQVQDNGGTANGGVDTDQSPNTLTFTVAAVNDAPVNTLPATQTILEDHSLALSGAAAISVSDVDSGSGNISVSVQALHGTFSSPVNGGASIGSSFALQNTVSYVNAFLHSMTYTPYPNSFGTDTITVTTNDQGNTGLGGAKATTSSFDIVVTPVNDAPFGTDKTITTNEDTAYTIAPGDFGFADPFEGGGLQAVKITTLPGAGTLTNNGTAVTAGQFVSAYDLYANRLVFTPAANANGAAYASFTFQVQDGDGTANGGVDTDQSPNTLTFNVTSVNDAPVADPVARQLIFTNEDTPYVFTAADFAFSDAKDNPQNAFKAVIFSQISVRGTITVNGVAVTDGSPVSAADVNAGHVVFTPDANANADGGLGTIQIQVRDDGGTANGGTDTSAAISKFISIRSVNDAPSGADRTITTNEDTVHRFAASDFGFSDPNDSQGALQAVRITTLPSAGTLTDDGVAVAAGQSVSVDDINGGKLVFTPAANANGAAYASFTFQVQDGGGTARGGVDTDQSPNTLTFDVTPVNDAPGGADKTVATLEDTGYAFAASDFGFSDAVEGNLLAAVKISTTPGTGTLTDNGTAVTAGQVVSLADIAAGHLVFTPSADANGAGYASFTFQVQDDGGTADGGADTDPTPRTLTIDVTPVSDAPSGADKTITTNEDTAYTVAASDFGFGDAGDTPANALVSVTVGTVSGGGALTLGGQAVTAGETIGAADIAAGSLVFTPDHDANGAGYAGFTFQVRDDGGTAGGGADTDPTPRTLTFDVTPVNDAPVIGAATQAALTYTISGQPVALLQGVTISDPDLPASFVNGQLVIASDVSDEGDAITLAAGSHFAVADNGYGNGTLTLSLVDGATSTEIGTVGGYGTDTVAIGYLTADATAAVLTDLAQSFVFTTAHVGDDATRHIGVQVGDGTLSGDDLGFAVAGPQTLTVQAPPAAPADLTLLNDTGASASDDLTRATKPVVGGTGVLGETITLYGDGQVLGTTTVGGDGTWSVASGTALGDGSHELAATATSAAGVTGPASSPLAIVIDTVAPATPAGIMVSADGVPINSPAAVNASSLTISGTAEADGVVTFYVNSVATATAVVDHGGHWSRTFDATTLSGVQRFAETVTDAAGNASVVTPSFKVQVTHLSGGTGDDTLTAPDSSKWYLFGGEGDDALTGNIGADTLNGGSGADHMAGGAGNDIYYVDDAGDTVVEASGQGNDKVYASVDYNAAGTSVENIFARSETGVHLTASDNATYILGGSGDDVLTGGQGNDRLSGGAGADHMAGGNGNDIYFVDDAGDVVTEAAGAGNDKVYATADYNAAGSSVETIVGRGTAGLVLTGGISAASIFGGDGNDVLTGGLLTDALGGGAGDDRLVATAGHDKLSGGAGADTFVLSAHASGSDSPQILDFLGGTDHIELSAADFHGALAGNTLDPDAFRVNTTGKAEDADDRFIYNSTNGGLYYDDDGIGADHRVFVAQLIHAPTLTAHDFTFG